MLSVTEKTHQCVFIDQNLEKRLETETNAISTGSQDAVYRAADGHVGWFAVYCDSVL
jgi:hypothetical protein